MKLEPLRVCIKCRHCDSKGGTNVCLHPIVISSCPNALSSKEPSINCFSERNKYFFGKCGFIGKLWEAM